MRMMYHQRIWRERFKQDTHFDAYESIVPEVIPR